MADAPAKPRIALRDLGIADILTLGNGVMGMLAIVTLTVETPYFAWTTAHGISDQVLAAALIGLGMVFDGLDGVVAQRLGGSALGGDLDSLSDLISFVVAPAVMVLITFQSIHPLTAIVVSITVLVFGQTRLARFNASPEHEASTFTGLPSPVAAAGTVLVSIVWDDLGIPAGVALGLIALFAFFMISTVPYPKARRRARSAAIGLAVFSLGIAVALLVYPSHAEPILVGAFAVTLVVIAFGPITWVRLRRRRGQGLDPLAPPDAPIEDEPAGP